MGTLVLVVDAELVKCLRKPYRRGEAVIERNHDRDQDENLRALREMAEQMRPKSSYEKGD